MPVYISFQISKLQICSELAKVLKNATWSQDTKETLEQIHFPASLVNENWLHRLECFTRTFCEMEYKYNIRKQVSEKYIFCER